RRGSVHLIHNFMTLGTAARRAAVRMQEPCRVIAIGRLIEKKGFDYLVRAVDLLRKMDRKVLLTIVGSGVQMHALRRETARLGLEGHVSFAGALPHDRIAGLLAESDMLVMPSVVPAGTEKSDGLPTVITEAMSMGVPVVSTDVASISDVVKDGETGRLVAQKDERALADAMASLMDDRENALRMADNAMKLVNSMLSEENTLARMEHLFRSHSAAAAEHPKAESSER
ncbi:MAG: glycosyltransferase family 4 protein, partial [Desulfovibrionaceae bacterium]|nr:glycosyltransferase family 4 protein [Desulfovibrionaceae bacterium]